MNTYYADILSRIPTPPEWWDEYAVPRFEPFTPHQLADIYADQCVLMEIACQGCGERFKVAMSQSAISRMMAMNSSDDALPSDLISNPDALHYGDPPNNNCCAAGPTMNSIPIQVLEAWKHEILQEWERVPSAERRIDCEWDDDAPLST